MKVVVNGRYTYEAPEGSVEVGDRVLCPEGGNLGGGPWVGTITALGSSYDGYTRELLGRPLEAKA